MLRLVTFHFIILSLSFQSLADYLSWGPEFKATVGEIWPKPFAQTTQTGRFYALDPNNFQLTAVNENCDILNAAIARYSGIIKASATNVYNRAPSTKVVEKITKISINLYTKCQQEMPQLDMDESYTLFGSGRLNANTIWGALRGLETLSQLLVPMPDGLLRIPDTEINDKPRFKYRGLMLDTARHFISKSKIFQLIEGMAYNKLNVFHWHVTDDSAFPYKSQIYPELAAKGAYNPSMTYTTTDVKEIVEFARLRGIRVIPEFDTPAHSASWAASHAELMTACAGKYAGQLGPFNPTLDATYDFLESFFSEIRSLFPDNYLHLGMDEVDSACWESNKQIRDYLAAKNLNLIDLLYLFPERFSANIEQLNWKQMVWQDTPINLNWMEWPTGTIAQIWKDYQATATKLTGRANAMDIIMSDGWYLYVLDTGADWEKFYALEPTNFNGTSKQKQKVIGGEACLWSEWINEHNVMPTTYPRVSAVAERLWSPLSTSAFNVEAARLRLEEQNCRLLSRGIEARPANGYGIC